VTKTQYFTATSLDGYIGDQDNSLAWLIGVNRTEGDDHSFRRFFPHVGAMAMGATTYEWVLDHDGLLDDPDKWHAYYPVG
jgi:dihydrofolate reductase